MCDSTNSRAIPRCDLINFDQTLVCLMQTKQFHVDSQQMKTRFVTYLSATAKRSVEPKVLATSREIDAP